MKRSGRSLQCSIGPNKLETKPSPDWKINKAPQTIVNPSIQSSCNTNEQHPETARLLALALNAAQRAYCPYSKFRVGAALLAEGQVFEGCNIENASFGLTVCAERVAVFSAVAAGKMRFDAIAITCPDVSGAAAINSLMPCGPCRQALAEFAGPDLIVIIDRVGVMRLSDLLPSPFKLS